jgi:hypothetical protein
MLENTPIRSSIVPGMSYCRAPEAIEWLCRVFGFDKHAVYPGPNNTIMHAELTLSATWRAGRSTRALGRQEGRWISFWPAEWISFRAAPAGGNAWHSWFF